MNNFRVKLSSPPPPPDHAFPEIGRLEVAVEMKEHVTI
jgi:hypothetical protein